MTLDTKSVFQLEDELERLLPPSQRGATSILEHDMRRGFLGSLITTRKPDAKLIAEREYYQVDWQDFLEYATDPATPEPRFGDFAPGRMLLYQGTAPTRTAFVSADIPDGSLGLAIRDVAIARSGFMVSVLMRLSSCFHPQQLISSAECRLERAEDNLVHIWFCPRDLSAEVLKPPESRRVVDGELSHELESHPIDEVDVMVGFPPRADSTHGFWTIIERGPMLDAWVEELSTRHESQDEIRRWTEHRDLGRELLNGMETHFSIARLAMRLPSYIEFMYDLIVSERVKVGTSAKTSVNRHKRTVRKQFPIYKIIKSIRVIHPEASTELTRSWTPPAYAFAVRGHWRQYGDPATVGHDPLGKVVFGRTWVRDYTKNEKGMGDLPFPTSTEYRDPGIVINIKQPLSYARDVITAEKQTQNTRSAITAPHSALAANRPERVKSTDGPSIEWCAKERAKLTAGLRHLIFRRDRYTCQICGRAQDRDQGVRLEVDHIIPVSRWGKTEESNLRTLCRECNSGKGPGD